MVWESSVSMLLNGSSPTMLPYLPGKTETILLFCYNDIQCYSIDARSGLSAGMYVTNVPEACWYVLNDCEANVVIVENQKQLDKTLQVSIGMHKYTLLN